MSTYPFYQVLIKVIKETEDTSGEGKELLRKVLSLFEDYLRISQTANIESIIPAIKDTSPERISDIIASHLFLPVEEKQNILETINPVERLRRLNFLLENEILKMQGRSVRSDRRRPSGRESKQPIFPSSGMRRKTSLMK